MIIGLTGDIACGKSTVARLLADYGAVVIDADLLVRELYAERSFATRVARLFEQPVLAADGTVDRALLAAVVFADAGALQRLEALVHPAVAARRDKRIAQVVQAGPPPAIVLEAVKLVESGQATRCDMVCWVTCDSVVQLERLVRERGLTHDAARVRQANQPSAAAKRALLSSKLLGSKPLVVLENNGSLDELRRQVQRLWDQLVQP